jgi:putative transcription factor
MALQCEVCGNPIHGELMSALIDGSILRVCNNCAKLGTPSTHRDVRIAPPQPRVMRSPPLDELELRRDFNLLIKQARQKMGLSQEDLGRRINEKPSVIRLLESGKLKPSDNLARKFAHFLKIEVLVPSESE